MSQTIDQLPAVSEPRQVQRVESQLPAPSGPPTIEHILMAAVQRGDVDPDALEKLVALQERVEARRAEKTFNAAMAAFKAECPPILKKNEAKDKNQRTMYRFVDLEELTKTIDRYLLKHGFSYSWDTDMLGELTVIICTVRHVDGHKQSSKFTCKATGTQIMSAAQIAASAVTFGRRHSLLCVLGLVADDDIDGRRPEPNPAPPADPSAPKVPTRDQRNAPRVSADELNNLFGEWKATRAPNGTRAEFATWARGVLLTECAMEAVKDWDPDAVAACWEALR